MPEQVPESFGSFSTKLDLAIELALAELPRIPGSLSDRASRHQFMRWALQEGVSTLARHFEDGKRLNALRWRFEIVEGPEVDWNFREYDRRAKAVDKLLEGTAA